MGTEQPPLEPPPDLWFAISEQAPLAMAVVEGAPQIVRHANPAFAQLMGFPAEDLLGKPLRELLPENDECVTLANRVFRTGRPETHAEQEQGSHHPLLWSYTLWPVVKDGCRTGVVILVTESTLVHETIQAVNEALMIGSVRQHELTEAAESLNTQLRDEILQREEAEGSLRESEERFRSLFASSPMAVFACDRAGVIQHYNPRAVELWGREPVCGSERHDGSIRLWRPDGTPLPPEQSPIVEVLRTGAPALHVEVSIERPDGSRVPALAIVAALKNGAGEITGAIISLVDLTERKKLEEQSLRAQRMESIGTLAGGIAHHLNNSLAPIMMSLSILKMRFPDDASQELIERLEKSARRGAEMVRQILTFARGIEGQRATVQVPQLIGEIEKIVNETFLRHIQLETHVPPGLGTVPGDPTQLQQVLLNLCLNARDAMPAGGVLVVSAANREIAATDAGLSQNPQAKAGPFILLEVRDSGTGMPARIMQNIFDPFFTTKEFGRGSGLGLSSSLAIVKSHGGFIHVASEPGKGSTFQIFLPALPSLAPSAPVPPASEMPRGDGQLILVVDDEAPMRDGMQQILEAFGYRVVLAGDGAQAVAIYSHRGTEIAAVITDMTMPVMEGLEAIRILRTMNPTLPIIGASGLAASTYAPQLARLGVKHFLSKPFTGPDLLSMVQQLLAGAEAAAP